MPDKNQHREDAMPIRWTAHIPQAMQQHGGGAKAARGEPPVQRAKGASVELKSDRAPTQSALDDGDEARCGDPTARSARPA